MAYNPVIGYDARGHRKWTPPWLIVSLILLLAACGGGTNSTGSPSGPTSQDLDSAQQAALQATLDLATGKVTLSWYDTFPDASSYQIEQQNSAGTWSVIDGVWPTGRSQRLLPLSLQWTAPVSAATTFRVSAVMSGYTVPLKTFDRQAAIQIVPPSPTPIIVLDQPEPVESPGVSITQGGSYPNVDYRLDDYAVFDSIAGSGPTYAATLSTSTLTTGTHVLTASLQVNNDLTFLLTRSVRVHTSGVAINMNVVPGPTTVDIYSIATSDSGVVSVEASVDGVQVGSLSALNACSPAPCAPGQPLNAYHFSFAASTVTTGQYNVTTRASETTGATAAAYATITLPSAPTATLASPVDGATVQQTLHASGTISAGTPGALELMLTLSGVPVYDTTVANPGAAVPFSTDISLTGVTPGNHTLDVYGRVGNTNYAPLTSALVTVPP
jgi:hypothetical protein